MRVAIILLGVVAALVCFAWVVAKPAWDSIGAFAAVLVGVATTFYFDKRNAKGDTQRQTVSEHAVAIQAGRDVKINTDQNK